MKACRGLRKRRGGDAKHSHEFETTMINRILEFYMWPAHALKLTKWIIMFLLSAFTQNRFTYSFVVFPVYQIIFLAGVWLFAVTYTFIPIYPWLILLLIPQIIFIGFPAFSTWHLSCVLWGKGFFEIFLGLWPGIPLMVRLCDTFIDLFRPRPPR